MTTEEVDLYNDEIKREHRATERRKLWCDAYTAVLSRGRSTDRAHDAAGEAVEDYDERWPTENLGYESAVKVKLEAALARETNLSFQLHQMNDELHRARQEIARLTQQLSQKLNSRMAASGEAMATVLSGIMRTGDAVDYLETGRAALNAWRADTKAGR